ncbi:MAG TPA: glycoside hydrolase family 3 N-terminal domain-containing protein [Bryobacteraceae bacterium]|nr:glycoside hydrolase family 3 N-terminal domain-containing protein [Bryobacteraceae bacterium]
MFCLALVAALLPFALFSAPPPKHTIPKSAKKTAAASVTALSDEAIAARWMKTLTPREKIAQLIVIGFNGHPMNTRTRAYRTFVRLVAQEHIGGLILVNVDNGRTVAKADPLETASFINRMQRLASIPLLVSADFERGASMRVDATTVFPHAMAFTASRDPDEARIEGQITAKEARALGVQWLFFPDADVNNNPDNPIINIRSYGENPADVSAFATAFIEGAHSVAGTRVLTTAKHFPGHGDTATDTHLNLATITADKPRLEELEWAPFRAAIAAGTDAVMTAHIAVPALDDAGVPATLSPKILTGILREELGFRGIIVTDALDMGGIAKGFPNGDAAVRSLEAGADVLLMPPDPGAAINAIAAAVRSGRISQKRVDESVMRILMAKAHLGLATKKLVDLEAIPSIVNSPASNAAAQSIADRSVTLVRNENAFAPLQPDATTAYFLLTESPSSMEGQAFALEIRKRSVGARVTVLDPSMPDAEVQAAAQTAADASRYVVVAFASVAAYRGSVALNGSFPHLIETLTATKKPVGLVAMGNPYLLRNFPGVAMYMTTYTTVPPAEISAVKALFGEMPITGKLPVSIPGFANYGDGITR